MAMVVRSSRGPCGQLYTSVVRVALDPEKGCVGNVSVSRKPIMKGVSTTTLSLESAIRRVCASKATEFLKQSNRRLV